MKDLNSLKLSKQEINAIKEVYKIRGKNFTNAEIIKDFSNDTVTICNCVSGRKIAWYLDFLDDIAIYVDDFTRLTQEQLDKEIC